MNFSVPSKTKSHNLKYLKNAQANVYVLVSAKSSNELPNFQICLCETPVAHMLMNIGCLSL